MIPGPTFRSNATWFDEVDFDDPEIRALKLELRALWRKGIGSLVLVIPLSFLLGWMWEALKP